MRIIFLFCVLVSWTVSEVGFQHPQSGPYSSQVITSAELGSHFLGNDATFSLYSKNASRVLLEIYDKENIKYDYWLHKNTENVWQIRLKDVDRVIFYGFRLWGPNWKYSKEWRRGDSSQGFISDVDKNANRFNPNKVVFDPYARELSHDKSSLKIKTEIFASGSGSFKGQPRRNIDTGKWAPKSILFKENNNTHNKPNLAQKDAIIYEAHVRGITKHSSAMYLKDIVAGINGFENVVNVPKDYLGTYKGAGYFAKYLKALGFNTIELLPVHETDNDGNPDDNPGGNYWGYATYGYFAPDRRYAYDKSPGGPTREFKEMVAAFHREGIEVYLDVVYNHSGEGGTWDASGDTADILFFRGIDNASYYAIPSGVPNKYWDSTGCGNNLNCAQPVVKKLILDSLRYWIEEIGVDGFRFDLATVLGRDILPNFDFNRDAPFLKEIIKLQQQTGAKMVAEAWDVSWPGGYQVGQFPHGWCEWNGQYRDAVRRFIKGDGASTGFADYVNGSYSLYADQGGPHKSVNFIVAHDGFTLMDLVSYNQKNNKNPWPFGPSDGGNDSNDAWDCGGDKNIRRQQLRNLWTIQMFSRGVPMSVWGDEFARTQNGNNNPYNIDSIATWNNYRMINSDTPHVQSQIVYTDNFGTDSLKDNKNNIFLFVKELVHLRKKHHILRQENYLVPYRFTKATGGDLQGYDRAIRIHIDGENDTHFLLLINMWREKVDFTIPQIKERKWQRIIDTAHWAEVHSNIWPQGETTVAGNYTVKPWSVTVLQLK
ncbi:glycogen-debranching protein [Candidatus Uabimicrobium sp. HlEnr_7]|uniref:glycogen debranching protein n=1 Tax=Candidatus Uabimicrobium helgolandensis TaxID=3095367 RepID=UPI0035587A02